MQGAMRELGRQAILPHPQCLSGPAGSYRDAQCSGFGGKEIRNCGRVYAWNPSLRKHRNGGTAITLIPFCPGALVENPRCGVIQRGLEFVVTGTSSNLTPVAALSCIEAVKKVAAMWFDDTFKGAIIAVRGHCVRH